MGNELRSIARRFLSTTGPLDSEPAVDVVVDLEVVVRIKRFDFITTVLLSSSPARKVAGAHRQPASHRGINGGDPRSGVAAVHPRNALAGCRHRLVLRIRRRTQENGGNTKKRKQLKIKQAAVCQPYRQSASTFMPRPPRGGGGLDSVFCLCGLCNEAINPSIE